MDQHFNPAQLPPSRPGELNQLRNRWTLFERLLFRFTFCYLLLYIVPFPVEVIAGLIDRVPESVLEEPPESGALKFVNEWIVKPYGDRMDEAVLWIGARVFGVEITYRPRGSGDTTWNYVQVFGFAVVSATVAILWTFGAGLCRAIFRRERPAYPVLHEWLRVYVRFYVAYMMAVYGLVKIIKLQFSEPPTDALLHTYGESSPMHLLWTFMGASEGYNVFAGAGELLGGLLLCTRRTTLLGALVSFGVMAHVAALNFCYDVPVKLLSSHLILMSVFLMAPDLPWLAKVFLLGRRESPRPIVPLTRWRWLNWAFMLLRTIVVLTYLVLTVHGNYKTSKQMGDKAPKPPLYGLWEVDEFALNEKAHPPLTTDSARWQYVMFTKKGFRGSLVAITSMTGTRMFYLVEVDENAKTISLSRMGTATAPNVLHYRELEDGVMSVEGELESFADGKADKKNIKVKLRHTPDEKLLLKNRGFHWINETPYNTYGPRNAPPPGIPPAPKRP